MLDIFNTDAFGVVSLTNAINKMDFVPGRAGATAFAGAGEGIATTSASIEEDSETLSLLQTSKRGAPSQQETISKRILRSIAIPHIQEEATIQADEVQNVRSFGSNDQLQGVQEVVNKYLRKMARRMDLTLENLRLGALRGVVKDADGSTIVDLFSLMGTSQLSATDFTFGTSTTDVRGVCAGVIRNAKRNLKAGNWPPGALIWAFCSDSFFDKLLRHANVKGVYDGFAAAERRLGESYVHGIFEFGGIYFENYQGTDDNSTVAIADGDAVCFPVGIPGLFEEYYAPADFMETVNTLGLPRYAKQAVDQEFNRWVKLHAQMNPLPICTRPKVLQRLTTSN